uniref:Uncharacterized protein AlNc14C14G1660 n=1 Tax=Albugo laibachii Nc14 TaxID=890382 RepID=F0W3T4_9STRA|nr:PREDICTED: hypothetical protein [Albugo laibachii Nc14]|eukprot:CCA15754.1 PREDICTED: hypothetical protein [Albugo laibachii Nc14]
MVTRHVRNLETLNDNQNSQLSRFLKGFKSALKSSNRKQNLSSRWTRDRYLTRSRCNAKTDAVEDKNIRGVVNAVCELDPKNYGEAMMTQGKHKWMTAVSEELKALEENGVWEVVIPPTGSHVMHNKWDFKTKTEMNDDVERYKARFVTCGNEQLFGADYTLTLAAVMELSTVKLILDLSRRWNVPARHGDVPNAYVKAEKEPHLDVYMKVLKGMKIDQMDQKRYGVNDSSKLALLLKNSFYGLKLAVRLWSKLLHSRLCKAGFTQCTTDMCLYFRKDKDELTIVEVYVDDLLVTGTSRDAVDKFFKEMSALEIKYLGVVNKFLGLRI